MFFMGHVKQVDTVCVTQQTLGHMETNSCNTLQTCFSVREDRGSAHTVLYRTCHITIFHKPFR